MRPSPFGPQPAWEILTKQRALSIAALRTGVTYGRLRMMVMGYSAPTREVRTGLAELLGKPVEELFTPQALAAVPKTYKQRQLVPENGQMP